MTTLAQILASRWRSFLAIAGAIFAVLALAIMFLLPEPRVLLRSSVDIGNYFLRNEAWPIYSPDALAKRTLNVYIPQALSAMSKEGTSTRTLSALQSSLIDATQLSIAITTTVDENAEEAARQFQERIANLILAGESPRVEALRNRLAGINAATNLSIYEKQVSADREQIDRINKRIAEIENSRRDQETELASLLRNQPSASGPDEQASRHARIRQLQDQLANHATALTTLSIQQNSFVLALGATESLIQNLTEASIERQLEQKAFSEPRVSLPPTPALITPQRRRTGLLAVALVASLLVAFGIVIMIFNIQARNRP